MLVSGLPGAAEANEKLNSRLGPKNRCLSFLFQILFFLLVCVFLHCVLIVPAASAKTTDQFVGAAL